METISLIQKFESNFTTYRKILNEQSKLQALENYSISNLLFDCSISFGNSVHVSFTLGDDDHLHYEMVIQSFLLSYKKILLSQKLSLERELEVLHASNLTPFLRAAK